MLGLPPEKPDPTYCICGYDCYYSIMGTETSRTNLNPRQRLAAQLLATGHTGRQVAHALDVSAATVSGWRQQPQFHDYFICLANQVESETLGSVAGLRLRAVERLGELIEDSSVIAIRAAIAILQANPCSQDRNCEKRCVATSRRSRSSPLPDADGHFCTETDGLRGERPEDH